MADIIKVEHLSYVYNPGLPTAVTALDDVSFTVEEGIPKERIVEKLVKRFALASEDAASYYDGFIAASRSRC